MGELPFALAPEAALGAWLREAEREMEPHRTAGTYRGFDGTELPWQAVHADRPRANVVLLHGFTEFPEKYRELCRYLRQAGCTVWLPVLRGHGQGGIVHVDRFEDYVRDMACFLRDIVPERPLLFGHSMGGGVAARLLQERPDCAARAVLCSPMLCPQTGRAPHWLALGCARVLLRRGEREKSPLFSGAYDPNAEFSCSGCTSRARFRADGGACPERFSSRRSGPPGCADGSTCCGTRGRARFRAPPGRASGGTRGRACPTLPPCRCAGAYRCTRCAPPQLAAHVAGEPSTWCGCTPPHTVDHDAGGHQHWHPERRPEWHSGGGSAGDREGASAAAGCRVRGAKAAG